MYSGLKSEVFQAGSLVLCGNAKYTYVFTHGSKGELYCPKHLKFVKYLIWNEFSFLTCSEAFHCYQIVHNPRIHLHEPTGGCDPQNEKLGCRTGERDSLRSKWKQPAFPEVWFSPVLSLCKVGPACGLFCRELLRTRIRLTENGQLWGFRPLPADTWLLLTFCPPATTES